MAVDASGTGLVPGRIYSWEQIADLFDFSPGYFSLAGGMISRPEHGALLEPEDVLCLITTHPIADRRLRFLEEHQVAVAYDDGSGLVACGALAPALLDPRP